MTTNERLHTKADEAQTTIETDIAGYRVQALRDDIKQEEIGEIEWWIDPPYKASEVRERTWSLWLEIEDEGGEAKARTTMDMTRSDLEPLVEHLADAMGYELVEKEPTSTE